MNSDRAAQVPEHIAVIGAGVMGEALISALITSGIAPSSVFISEKRHERAIELTNRYGVGVLELHENVARSQAVLLVVKPQDMGAVLEEIAPHITASTLLVSFAAGKRIQFIAERVGQSIPIIRVMPNTPALVGEGMAGISLGPRVSASQRDFVHNFLSATGRTIEIEEALQDAVTAVSGSGPAYFFAFVEAMAQAGRELGLTTEVAMELTVQTLVGAAKLLSVSGKSATTLRENVTSPNGTTAAALNSFSSSGLNDMVRVAMTAARDRSQELA